MKREDRRKTNPYRGEGASWLQSGDNLLKTILFFCRSSEAEVTEEVKAEEVNAKAIELLLEEKAKLLLEEKAKAKAIEEKAKEAVKDLQKTLQTPLTGG